MMNEALKGGTKMFADVNADVKQQEIKELVALS